MTAAPVRPGRPATLLWLAGNALRLTILAVPPVIAEIRDDFQLNATQVGLLSSIPPAFFALAALGGSLLVSRLGLMRATVGGLLVIAIGGALRGLSPNYATLLATTIIMSIGVAVMQPIMPSAVRQWLPTRVALGTAIYTNGILIGEVLPVWLTIPFLLPLFGSWRGALAAWSVPVAMIAIVIMLFAPRATAGTRPAAAPQQWLPDWHRGLVWRLGSLFWGITAIYFTTNAFLPVYLKSVGRPDLIAGALTALNLGQIPASLLLLVFGGRLERRAWPYIASGVLSLACLAGVVFDVGTTTIVWAAVLGFSDATVFILALVLPAALCKPEDVARTAAGTFTLCYGGAVLTSIVSGIAWDVSGVSAFAFAPIAVGAAALVVLPLSMRRHGDLA